MKNMQLPLVLVKLFHPHHTNQHRPKVLHPEAYFVFVGIILSFIIGLRLVVNFASSAQGILGFASSITASQVVQETNAERAKQNLPPLEINPALNEAALAKAQHMFSHQYWAHVSPDGTQPWDFIKKSGYTYKAAGENLARDFSNTDDMVVAWMKSPTHKENIMSPKYTQIGIAVVDGELQGYETTLVVQMFGSPAVAKPQIEPNQKQNEPVTLSPETPAEPAVAELTGTEIAQLPPVVLADHDTGLTRSPLFSPLQLTKAFFLGLIMMIITTLVYDTVIMNDPNTVRMVGKNLAHVIFLMAVGFLLIFFKGGIVG
jgi:hypothetical protein